MASSEYHEEKIPVPGAELWAESSGDGPAMVLAHGGPGMNDNLRPLATMVDDLAMVHRFDQRACGRSTGSARGQTVASAVADLEALRRHWGHDRWIVGGHSWGASLALFYTLNYFEHVMAVVYVSGPGVKRIENASARSRMDRLTPAEKEAFAEAKTRAGAGDPTAAAELAQFFWRTDFSDPANAPDFRVKPLFDYPRNDEVGNVLTASANESLSGGGLADAVGQISVPVLILHGREDPLPVEGAIDLASRLPAAELVVLDNVGHDVWLEDAAATEEALRRFLERAIA